MTPLPRIYISNIYAIENTPVYISIFSTWFYYSKREKKGLGSIFWTEWRTSILKYIVIHFNIIGIFWFNAKVTLADLVLHLKEW